MAEHLDRKQLAELREAASGSAGNVLISRATLELLLAGVDHLDAACAAIGPARLGGGPEYLARAVAELVADARRLRAIAAGRDRAIAAELRELASYYNPTWHENVIRRLRAGEPASRVLAITVQDQLLARAAELDPEPAAAEERYCVDSGRPVRLIPGDRCLSHGAEAHPCFTAIRSPRCQHRRLSPNHPYARCDECGKDLREPAAGEVASDG